MKSKIVRFPYESLRNEVHVAYHTDVDALFDIYAPEKLNIVPQYNSYKTAYNDEIAALDIVLKSELTAEIEKQDIVRDTIYRGFTDAVKSATRHFNADKRAAAARVENIVAHYGNIVTRTLDAETAAIDDLLRELKMSAYPADIAALALGDWLVQLDTENATFKTLMQERYAEAASRTTLRMRPARKATDAAFRAMISQVEALVLVNGETGYDKFISELNVISERFRNILAQEKGKRNGKNKES
ncbi:MAG: DUF6261 family protein [Prevotellaceae bacterium]|jgi:hypothetical protein|nr:DUF6261 family protein [Prevotellaceae bacterium]